MSVRMKNKPLVLFTALVAAAGLAGVAAVLNSLFPQASAVGFMVRSAPLAVVIPIVLIGFSWLCDRLDRPSDQETYRFAVGRNSRSSDCNARHEVDEVDRRVSARSAPSRQTRHPNESSPIIVPVSIREQSFRLVVPVKKWWVGQ
jgi:hypothetical protein